MNRIVIILLFVATLGFSKQKNVLKVEISYQKSNSEIIGIIYIDNDNIFGADEIIKITNSNEWIYLKSSKRYEEFNQEVNRGLISDKGILIDFEHDISNQKYIIWKKGNINFYLDSTKIDTLAPRDISQKDEILVACIKNIGPKSSSLVSKKELCSCMVNDILSNNTFTDKDKEEILNNWKSKSKIKNEYEEVLQQVLLNCASKLGIQICF